MKVICIGNRFINPDGAALWLYDAAISRIWPTNIQWIEGGLGGLNLSPHFDTQEDIILIDYMPQYANATTLSLSNILSKQPNHYDHATALYYLLHSLPTLYKHLPNITCLACNPINHDWKQQLLSHVKQLANGYEQVA